MQASFRGFFSPQNVDVGRLPATAKHCETSKRLFELIDWLIVWLFDWFAAVLGSIWNLMLLGSFCKLSKTGVKIVILC